ncbi:hypothetical protein ACFWM1_07805 [Nocardia sp. NPDC058379]|uniref:hypothetical protein n=1 Tax=unclassified Nocardia TaxID=2637762 RepID=UPI00365B9B01
MRGREVSRAPGARRLTRPLLQRVTRLPGRRMCLTWALLPRELPRLPGRRMRRWTGSLLLRELTGPTRGRPGALRRTTRTTARSGTLLRELTGLSGQLNPGNTLAGRTVRPIAIGRARRIRRTITRPIGGHGPKSGWRLVGGTISGLTRFEAGIGGPIRPSFRRPGTRRGDVPLVFPARHATLPRRDRGRAFRSVAAIVVVVPMSGIIVAHHASCTRRNPRIPPVR